MFHRVKVLLARVSLSTFAILMVEAVYSSERTVIYQTTRRHTLEGSNLQVKDVPSMKPVSRRSRLEKHIVMSSAVHDGAGDLGWGEDVTDTLMNPVWQNSKEF
jgi:hypothetical protein